MFSLKHNFTKWIDIDEAQYFLAKNLGIIESDTSFIETKHIYWSDNEVGNKLVRILDFFVEQGLMRKRDEPDLQYIWNNK